MTAPELDEPELDEPELDEPELDEPELDEPELDEPELPVLQGVPTLTPEQEQRLQKFYPEAAQRYREERAKLDALKLPD